MLVDDRCPILLTYTERPGLLQLAVILELFDDPDVLT